MSSRRGAAVAILTFVAADPKIFGIYEIRILGTDSGDGIVTATKVRIATAAAVVGQTRTLSMAAPLIPHGRCTR
jgi:hypothetical protein